MRTWVITTVRETVMFVKMESDVFFGGADSEVEAKLPSCHPFKVHKRNWLQLKHRVRRVNPLSICWIELLIRLFSFSINLQILSKCIHVFLCPWRVRKCFFKDLENNFPEPKVNPSKISQHFLGGVVVAENGFNFTATFLKNCYACCIYLALMRQN